MTTQAVAQRALDSIEKRILELDESVQDKVRNYAEAIGMFAADNGSIGTMALNLAAARRAVEVLP